jgi:two-component system sensor histidine kinase SenX3
VVLAGLLGIVLGIAGAALIMRRPASGRPPRPVDAGDGAPHERASLASLVIDALDSGVAVIDVDYAPRTANAAIGRFELVVDSWVDPRLVDIVGLARRSGSVQRQEFELVPAHRSQEPRSVGVTAVPLPGDGEGFVAVLVTDVTDARRLDAVRRDFVANVSHELKTPVGALSLLAETLFAAADDPEAVAHFAAQVQRESARLAALIAELIELSRLQGAEPLGPVEPYSVRALLHEVLDRARVPASVAGITLVAADPGDAAFLGSGRQLVTAIGNLIDNSIAYSAPGTRIALGVRTDSDSTPSELAGTHSARVGSSSAGPWVEISVSDQGIGIAEPDLERVFERFYRVDPARSRATGGTGLGLAIVKHIVSNHGGTISVWSVEGAGSTFTVRLPRAVGVLPPRPAAPELLGAGKSAVSSKSTQHHRPLEGAG